MPDSETSKTLATPASARASKDFHILLPWEEATEIERAAADRGLRPTHIIRERLSEWRQIQPLMQERDRQEITMEAIRFMVEQIFLHSAPNDETRTQWQEWVTQIRQRLSQLPHQ